MNFLELIGACVLLLLAGIVLLFVAVITDGFPPLLRLLAFIGALVGMGYLVMKFRDYLPF